MSEDRPRIFLCYASEDKAFVDESYIRMKDAGLNPWMDKPPAPYQDQGIPPGALWDSEIKKQIRVSAYFLAFLSRTSIEKRGYVQREYRIALDQMSEMPAGQVFLVPVRIEDCEVPDIAVGSISFRDVQWIDAHQGGLLNLINFLKNDNQQRLGRIQRPEHQELFVTDATELLNAIGSNRTIKLAPGDYTLTEAPRRYSRCVRFKPVFDGQAVVLSELVNLKLIGDETKQSRIIATPRYADVLTFEKSPSILSSQHYRFTLLAPNCLCESAKGVWRWRDGEWPLWWR